MWETVWEARAFPRPALIRHGWHATISYQPKLLPSNTQPKPTNKKRLTGIQSSTLIGVNEKATWTWGGGELMTKWSLLHKEMKLLQTWNKILLDSLGVIFSHFPIGFLSNGFIIFNMFVRYPSHLLPSPVGFLANGFLFHEWKSWLWASSVTAASSKSNGRK